jgi:putative flavoprotein involved in K+ transport
VRRPGNTRTATTLVVGAGHAGLAMSRCLTERSIDHVVLERGEVANSWRTERWDSLRLLTPNWQTRLPGDYHCGGDPDGYMTMAELIDQLDGYALGIESPIETDTTVTSVRVVDHGFAVSTTNGEWWCRAVVVASGACNRAVVPDCATGLPAGVTSLTPMEYRNPDELDPGGVLIVGAGATGIQLADEIRRSGRAVTLAVGGHVRAPRTYRGCDIMWWLDRTGILGERYDEVDDIARARRLPSFQLVGSPERQTVDLNSLRRAGVRTVGRVAGVRDGVVQFSGSLRNQCKLADLKLGRMLDAIDEWAARTGVDANVAPPERPSPTEVDGDPLLHLELTTGAVRTVIWATGYRPELGWLDVPVRDRAGRLLHDGGVTQVEGLYLMGMPFMRRRSSTLIAGAAADAEYLSDHLVAHLAGEAARRLHDHLRIGR